METNNNGMEQNSLLKENSSGFTNTPKFPDSVYANLPEPIKKLLSLFDARGRQKDIFLFSLIHILSTCMPKVFGRYFGKRLSPNLYGMVGGPSGTGKSAMATALSITEPIIKKFSEKNKEELAKHEAALALYKADKTLPKPKQPKPRLFKIPANSSAAGIIQLFENSPYALIAETEADTLGNILGQRNFGNWSDLLRKFYHHESYSYYRKTDKEFIELRERNLSLLLTGTPQQLKNLLKGAETGLLSRIGFYVYDENPVFIDPFGKENNIIEDAITEYSKEVEAMFFGLMEREQEIEFRLTLEQQTKFTEKFKPIVDEYYDMSGSDAASIAMRLGVIFFRIAMILTVVRGYKERESEFVCSDIDYELAEAVVDLLAEHAIVVLSTFPDEKKTLAGIGALPEEIIKSNITKPFTGKWLIGECEKRGVSRRTSFRAINQMENRGIIKRVGRGIYEKIGQPVS